MRPRKALLTQFPQKTVSLTVFLSASAALRSAGGDLEKAMCIVSSSPRKPEKKSKAAANSKPRDLNVSMSLEEDEGTPLKQQPGKASGKKRYRGDSRPCGYGAFRGRGQFALREEEPNRRDKQKPAKSRKQLGSSERKYKPVLTKKNPRREWDEDMEGSDFSESEIELMSEEESSGDDDSVLDRKKNAKKTMKSHMGTTSVHW
ncbi:hypothetical protein THAOC_33060 [Thalassiosira oceanica]|uniref:Uncharacterized protein n=1 Tax=Thalassiosira oceanica TaxID=159749 RepID=K0R7Y5_THAOC|nr:hypothetical protein THAOC_33060 [Thalassiosira oceanica]|eukprot:EJK48169.1 hypothetical protein THAOC_33060 [Thalassiosira oceanica]